MKEKKFASVGNELAERTKSPLLVEEAHELANRQSILSRSMFLAATLQGERPCHLLRLTKEP